MSTAMRYERAWEICFHKVDKWKKEIIIEEPFGRFACELAHEAAMLAESKVSNKDLESQSMQITGVQ